MTYRDDHEAALARAEALDEELAQERAKNRETEEEARAAEAKVAELEREVARLREVAREQEPPRSALQPPADPPEPAPDKKAASGGGAIATVIAIVIVVLFLVCVGRARNHHDEAKHAPSNFQMTDEDIRRAAQQTAREINQSMRDSLLDGGSDPAFVDAVYPKTP